MRINLGGLMAGFMVPYIWAFGVLLSWRWPAFRFSLNDYVGSFGIDMNRYRYDELFWTSFYLGWALSIGIAIAAIVSLVQWL